MSGLILLLAGLGGAPVVDPGNLATLRQVANNTRHWRITTSTDATGGTTYMTQHTVRSQSKALRLAYGVHGFSDITSMTIRAALAINGTVYPLTWGGVRDVTIQRLTMSISDPLPDSVVVNAGDVIQTRFYSGPGTKVMYSPAAWDTATAGEVASDLTASGSMSATITSAHPPQGVYGLALSTAKAFMGLGDSILESGWMRRASEATSVAWADLGQWAEAIPSVTGGNFMPERLPQSPTLPYTLALCEYGTNDNTLTVAQLQAKWITFWNAVSAKGVRLGQTTLTPRPTSTDSWSTTGGQTPWDKDAAWRLPLNAWLRDGAPIIAGVAAATGTTDPVAKRAGQTGHPLIGVCDIADAAETARNSGVWKVPGGVSAVSDGTHPTRAGADLLQPVAQAWIAANL